MNTSSHLLLTIFLLSSECLPYCVGYVTPTGHLCFYQSSALQSYLTQVAAVFEAANQFWVALESPSLSWQTSQQTASVFLERWRILVDLRDNSQDFQLLEFVAEPSPTNRQLANLEVDLVPALTRPIPNPSFHKDCQRYLQRASPKPIDLSRIPKWTREDLHKLSPSSLDEYHRLIEEHVSLIHTGFQFGSYDQERRKQFLRQLQNVEERWNILFHRCHLMGILSPDYVQLSHVYLANIGYDKEGDYHRMRKRNQQRLSKGRRLCYRTPDPIQQPTLRWTRGLWKQVLVKPLVFGKTAWGQCKDTVHAWWKRRKARAVRIDCPEEPFM